MDQEIAEDIPEYYEALSLWNPWAMLMRVREKRIETRGWGTSYRGLVAIHATAKSPSQFLNLRTQEPFKTALASLPRREMLPGMPGTLPAMIEGAVIAIGLLQIVTKIIDEQHAYKIANNNGAINELEFGDFTPGRHAWVFRGIEPVDPPIPAKGGRGLWHWTPPPAERDRVRALIASRSSSDWQRR